jgi:hypothetical protein
MMNRTGISNGPVSIPGPETEKKFRFQVHGSVLSDDNNVCAELGGS